MREKRGTHAKEQRKQGKVAAKPPKAIDEDLYKISPELLRSSKRKKRPGLFSCLVPACVS
ncbi:hypothetical protein OIU78_022392 [Salix suchowensis]|nr:hypothetical protein OIU78_022392 [Salix suchowensis]